MGTRGGYRYRPPLPRSQSRGKVAWQPLSTDYPKEFCTWRMLPMRRTQKAYQHLDPLIDDDIYRDFELFLKEVGGARPKGYELDRIDPERGYVKGNMRWADRLTQNRNKRSSPRYRGEPIRIVAERMGLNPDQVAGRVGNGWTVEEALFTPPCKNGYTRYGKPSAHNRIHTRNQHTKGARK